MSKVLKAFIPKHISNKTVLAVYDFLRKWSGVSKRIIVKHSAANKITLSDSADSPLKAGPGFVENQREWSDVRIGCGKKATMQHSGCGVFAVYNALYALTGEYGVEKMLELIARFEKRGLALKGRLGVSPKAIYEYFVENGFDVAMKMQQEATILNQLGADYEALLVTFYNDKSDISRMVHTVCVSRNPRGEFFAHNAFYKMNNQYTAMPFGEKGFLSLQEAVDNLSKNPQVICAIGVRPCVKREV